MSELVSYARHDDVAVLTVDNPPVNAMSSGVPEGIRAGVERATEDAEVRALVLIGAGKTFIAGADIREFNSPRGAGVGSALKQALEVLENSKKPVVVAIHGTALGGGLETAMACHYRVIAPSGQVGQPEVKLGLIPGAGGTQRLPRLAGVAKAVEMCAFGAPIKAADAVASGIADQIIEGDLLTGALAFAREVAGKPPVRTRDRNEKLSGVDAAVFSTARKQAKKKMRGQSAPLAAIDAVEASTRLFFKEGMQLEARLFEECRQSTQSKAMIHAFFGERTVSKVPDIPADTKTYVIQSAAIVGAGTMGGGIAMCFADAGIPVIVKETQQAALDRGLNTIRANYARTVSSGRISQAAMDERMARITGQLGYEGFENADIVIEAVFENMAVKKQVFAEIDSIAKQGCILATNTSSLDIDEIAATTSRPSMVVGVHFFSPANIMRLVEVVRGKQTSGEVLATAMALTKKLGKIGVVSGNCYGFIGNRMMQAYVREAKFLLEEGATVESVNGAIYEFGLAMGPFAMEDSVGLDVMHHIDIEAKRFEKPGVRRPIVLERMIEAGRLGLKNGKGWSKYDESKKASPDPEVAALIEKASKESDIARREISKEEIVDRCLLALVNEGARILEEGIALRAVDIDIVYLTGYGFPVWRGGPMYYADTVGLKNVLARIEEFGAKFGLVRWTPAPLLKRLAEEGKGFHS
ncbi:MAG: 3-hydroxyacyl-CoA dehydrogenase NAD-binding domain-containing protein [Bryobacteraceae bacterium]